MKNKIFALALPLMAVAIWALSSGVTQAATAINTCQDLQNISAYPADSYYLAGNVDCTMTTAWNAKQGFLSIADFSGELDGRGYAVNGLYQRTTIKNGGIFANTNGATIHNLTLANFNLTTSDTQRTVHSLKESSNIGAVAGYAVGSKIYNVNVINANMVGNNNTGGIVGVAENTVIATSKVSYSAAGTKSIRGVFAGGLVGLATYNSQIINSYNSNTFTGPAVMGNVAGGIAGVLENGSRIFNTYSSGTALVGDNLGGLVGRTGVDTWVLNSFSKGVTFAKGPYIGVTNQGCLFGQFVVGSKAANLAFDSGDNCVKQVGNQPAFHQNDVNAVNLSVVSAATQPVNNWDFGTVWQMGGDGNPDLIDGQSLKYCGDGQKNLVFESCDLTNGAVCPANTSGKASCNNTCQLVTTACLASASAACGNGKLEAGEICDGANLGGKTCQSLGYVSGTPTCSADCKSLLVDNCNICVDSDNGKTYGIKGTAKIQSSGGQAVAGSELTDKCGAGNSLTEYFCNTSPSITSIITSVNYACPNGCIDGACVSAVVNPPAPQALNPVRAVLDSVTEAKMIIESGRTSAGLTALLAADLLTQDSAKQRLYYNQYALPIITSFGPLSTSAGYALNNFITYGPPSLANMTPAARSQEISKFTAKYSDAPSNWGDYDEIIKAAPHVLGEKIFNLWELVKPISSIFD